MPCTKSAAQRGRLPLVKQKNNNFLLQMSLISNLGTTLLKDRIYSICFLVYTGWPNFATKSEGMARLEIFLCSYKHVQRCPRFLLSIISHFPTKIAVFLHSTILRNFKGNQFSKGMGWELTGALITYIRAKFHQKTNIIFLIIRKNSSAKIAIIHIIR